MNQRKSSTLDTHALEAYGSKFEICNTLLIIRYIGLKIKPATIQVKSFVNFVVKKLEILMKIVGILVVMSVLTFSASSFAESSAVNERKHIDTVETPGLDTVLDIPLRIGGFATTLVGTGLFIGTSPFTGLMTAIYPHNAIEKAAEFLVVRPGVYTFVRPTGDFNYDSRPSDEK